MLRLEINKVLLPARLTIQGTDPVSAVTLSLLEPETQVTPPPQSPLTAKHSFLLPHLVPTPPPTPHIYFFLLQEDSSSWTFPVPSICGIR